MYGPKPRGHWNSLSQTEYRGLEPGRWYRVICEFTDFDDVVHPVAERFQYLGHAYSGYHSGLSLFVSLDGVQEWHIRLLDDGPDCVAARLSTFLLADP